MDRFLEREQGRALFELPPQPAQPVHPAYQTCHRRFQQWQRAGVMDRLLAALARDLEQRGQINLDECFVDGSFSAAKKGGPGSARPMEDRAAVCVAAKLPQAGHVL